MRKKPKEPTVPSAMQDTARHEIVSLLKQGEQSAKEVSSAIGISEKDVYDHLEHVRKTLHASGYRLVVTPAECKKCGFQFSKRERLRKPGKCPVCRGEAIHEPLFSIEGAPNDSADT